MNAYEEHLRDSAPDSSRWDGFDRGTVWADEELECTRKVIDSMTNKAGRLVVIAEFSTRYDLWYEVSVDGVTVYSGEQWDRHHAIHVGRWWMK